MTKLIIDELCHCGALKSEHDGVINHGGCEETDCFKFTWKSRLDEAQVQVLFELQGRGRMGATEFSDAIIGPLIKMGLVAGTAPQIVLTLAGCRVTEMLQRRVTEMLQEKKL